MAGHHSHPGTSVGDVKILLIEDNFLIAMHLERILEQEGCEVVGPFATAREGLDALSLETVDGALLDFSLRDGTSVPIAEELTRRGCGFVFVTGLGGASDIPQKFSGVPRLSKPIPDSDIREAIRSFELHRL
jgi:DNA-binding NarL/FixJ family response regulator